MKDTGRIELPKGMTANERAKDGLEYPSKKEYRVTLDVTVQADSASAASFIAWNERYALNVRVQETQPDEPFRDDSTSEDIALAGRAVQLINDTVSLAGRNARLVNHGLGPVLTNIRSNRPSDLEAQAGGLDYTEPVDSIGE